MTNMNQLNQFVRNPLLASVAVRKGLSYKTLEITATLLNRTPAQVADVIGVPSSTLARRRLAKRLSAEESDRLYRLLRVADLASEVLGSQERANAWLNGSKLALSNAVPLELLDTDAGATAVETLLHQISEGLFV